LYHFVVDSDASSSDRIVFKRPQKRAIDEADPPASLFGAANNKKSKSLHSDKTNSSDDKNLTSKKVANVKLLSFDEDEEEVV